VLWYIGSTIMKNLNQWMLAAILIICGMTVFTSCSDSNDDKGKEETSKNQKEFMEHVKSSMKSVAENLNFGSWHMGNNLNQEFNNEVLNNPEFEKAIIPLFNQNVRKSIRPVTAGSELAERGYKYEATMDFTSFTYRFIQRLDLTGFDIEKADNFEIVLQDNVWEPGQVYHINLLLKFGGPTHKVISEAMSNDTLAVVMLIPEDLEMSISSDYDGNNVTELEGTFHNKIQPMSNSQYAMLSASPWTISGTVKSDVNETDIDREMVKDATLLDFSVTQNPTTHKSDIYLSFIHNDRKMLQLEAKNTNLNGKTDFSYITTGSSLLEIFGAIVAGNSIDNMVLTLNDDLTTTLRVTDCHKALQLALASSEARRSYANEATIDQYTQQLNQIITGELFCKGVNQTIPIQLQTVKFGVDYITMPAFKFDDKQGYVPLKQLVEPETMEYTLNIVDHAAEPMMQAMIVVRQVTQYLQTLFLAYNKSQE